MKDVIARAIGSGIGLLWVAGLVTNLFAAWSAGAFYWAIGGTLIMPIGVIRGICYWFGVAY